MSQPTLNKRGSRWWLVLCYAAILLTGLALTVEAQVLPRPGRARKIQRRAERLEKQNERRQPNALTEPPATSGNPSVPATPAGTRLTAPPNHLAGISQTRDLTQLLTPEQRSMIIRGFGRAPALVLIFNQLNLTDAQKNEIRAISRRVGNRLVVAQQEMARLNDQLELAIYGDEFNAARVDELAAQAADKQAEVIKLRSNIEAQVRQALTPDQLFAYRILLSEMTVSGRRPAAQLLRQQQQMQRRGIGVPPARPNQTPPPENDDELPQ